MSDVKSVKVNGKEYQLQVATLGRMRKAAEAERDLGKLLSDMLEDEGFAKMVERWKELMGVILVGGESIDVADAPVSELNGAKADFFAQVTPKR